jgi:hypothetical protein
MIFHSDPWPDRWVSVRLRIDERGRLLFDAADNLGQTTRGVIDSPGLPIVLGWAMTSEEVPGGLDPTERAKLQDLLLPPTIRRLVMEALDSMPQRRDGPHVQVDLALPYFLQVPAELSPFPWENLPLSERRVEIVRRPSGKRFAAPAPSLPIRCATLRGEWDDLLSEAFGSLGIPGLDPEGRVLRLEILKSIEDLLGANAPDVVAVDERTFRSLARSFGRRSEPTGVRLWVVATDSPWRLADRSLQPSRGALLAAPETVARGVALHVIASLVHDQALHEAVAEIRSEIRERGQDPQILLLSSPTELHGLRLSAALLRMRAELESIEASLPKMDPALVEQIAAAAPQDAALRGDVESLLQYGSSLNWNPASVTSISVNFGRESWGLPPLVDASRETENLLRSLEPLKAQARSAASRWGEVVERHLRRVVNISILRYSAPPHARLWDPGWFVVRDSDTLAANRFYRLRVEIGARLKESLVSGAQPPIDPLLSDPEDRDGHDLDIVVFGLDFECEPPLRRIHLPRFGPSDSVDFDFRTPPDARTARMRVCVYEGNHLLQSYLVHAAVTAADEQQQDHAVSVKLEYSKTAGFNNLDQFGDRFLHLGLNDAGGTHTLTVKKDNETATVHLDPNIIGPAVKLARDLLKAATGDERHPGFPADQALLPPSKKFEQLIRDLADAGKALYDHIWDDAPRHMQGALRKVREDTDRILQVSRFDQNYVFPWTMLYDFPLTVPARRTSAIEVCPGFTRQVGGETISCSDCLRDCLHKADKSKTFCVYGFWGLRHQVEQVLHTPQKEEETIRDLRPIRDGAIQISVGLQGGSAGKLPSQLGGVFGNTLVREVRSMQGLLDDLFSDQQRPALLVLVGHCGGTTIDLPAGEQLVPEDIRSRVQAEKEWGDPHPVIVLAACESVSVTLETLTSFLPAFADAGASAIVGTEIVVFESLACRVARELATYLLEKRFPLGDAVLRLRRVLLCEGNPLGFVFTPYGSAELARR